MPKNITDFVTALNIAEMQREYLFTFSNRYSENVYTFQVNKELFDKALEKRELLTGEAQIVNFGEIEEQVIKSKGMHI